jgi:DNA topoisomerase I
LIVDSQFRIQAIGVNIQGTKSITTEMILDPVESSRLAHLRYLSDDTPGITRKRRGKNFQYFDPEGKPLRDKEVIGRIKSMAIPPAWTKVWICPHPNGHLQATGRDAKRRKQSIYHPRWREVRDETKYGRMKLFGEALPLIRERVEADLALHGLPREKVLATIVRLLETTFIRIGNDEYAKENHSYGLATMRTKHVDVEGANVRFKFHGKGGKQHIIDINDRRLARIIKRCLDLPGYELFQYVDDGCVRSVDASDVNEYLHSITNQPFTAKDFRTWGGSVLACRALCECEPCQSPTQAKKNVLEAIKYVAERLGNTPAICRKCYVHPTVLDSYMRGELVRILEAAEKKIAKDIHSLRNEEVQLMFLLENGLKAAA